MAIDLELPKVPIMEGFKQGEEAVNKLLTHPYERQKKSLDVEHQQQVNALYPRLTKSQIDSYNALANQRKNITNMGGTRSSVGYKDLMALKNMIMQEKGVDEREAMQLTNRALAGEDVDLGGMAKNMLDQVIKRGTTSGALNTMIQAKGADAEVQKLSELSNQWLAPYGDTYFNMNPQQIMDTFKNDDESQKRLGKFIAAQALQFDIAPARSRLAGVTPGVTLTNELVNVGMQNIGSRYPRLSAKARKYASEYINQALKEGFKERQKSGISASSAVHRGETSEKSMNKPTDIVQEVKVIKWGKDKQGNPIRL